MRDLGRGGVTLNETTEGKKKEGVTFLFLQGELFVKEEKELRKETGSK